MRRPVAAAVVVVAFGVADLGLRLDADATKQSIARRWLRWPARAGRAFSPC